MARDSRAPCGREVLAVVQCLLAYDVGAASVNSLTLLHATIATTGAGFQDRAVFRNRRPICVVSDRRLAGRVLQVTTIFSNATPHVIHAHTAASQAAVLLCRVFPVIKAKYGVDSSSDASDD